MRENGRCSGIEAISVASLREEKFLENANPQRRRVEKICQTTYEYSLYAKRLQLYRFIYAR